MALPTGKYNLVNAKTNTEAVILDDDDCSEVVTVPVQVKDGSRKYEWSITNLGQNLYHIQHAVLSAVPTYDPEPQVNDRVLAEETDPKEWIIRPAGGGNYSIAPAEHPTLFWTSRSEEPKAPLEFGESVNSKQSHWGFNMQHQPNAKPVFTRVANRTNRKGFFSTIGGYVKAGWEVVKEAAKTVAAAATRTWATVADFARSKGSATFKRVATATKEAGSATFDRVATSTKEARSAAFNAGSATFDRVATSTKEARSAAYTEVEKVAKRAEEVANTTWSRVQNVGKGSGTYFSLKTKQKVA